MLKEIRKQQLITAVLVMVEFVVFSALIAMLHTIGSKAWNTMAVEITMTMLLLGAVLLTMARCSRKIKNSANSLTEDLNAEKAAVNTLQTQFQEAIEKRVYDLQVVNGSLNREIGERTQAEEEIRELQKQLRLILDSAGEGIFGLDNLGNVTFMNQAASLMVGWEIEDMLGKSHHELIHHTHPDGTVHPVEDCPIYMAYQDGDVHYKSDDVFWCKNGTSFPVEYSSTPIRDRGMLTGAVVVFRDTTTFK